MNLAALRRSPVCAVVVVVLVLLPFSLDAACVGPPDVGFALSVPSTLSEKTAWFEIGAFAGGVCPDATQLAGGIPLAGPVARVVFASGDAAPPAFGDLPKGSYGFAAVARAADCSVIGQGCSVVDTGGTSGISITVSPIANPVGACEQGSECNDAVCVPEGDAGGSGPGSGCSLAFVGGGPLADPLGLDSTLLSPPAIVATGSGFLLAYREFDPSIGRARITLIPIDDRGAASAPQRIALPNRCTSSPESDGTALCWSGSSGVVAASRRACPTSGPGVDVFTVDAHGVSSGGAFTSTGTDGVLLSKGHALASSPSGVLLANIDARTRVATVTPVNGTSLASSTFPFGDVTDALGAYVTATSMGTGLLSLGSTTVGSDAGSDATTDSAPITAEGGSTLETASFTSLGSGAKLSALPAANDFQGSWLSLSGVDSRILVATNGAPTSNPIVWYAFDVGVVTPAHSDSFAPQVAGNVVYADVALHGDNAFFAAEVGTSISLFAFRKASTYPELLVENDFANDERIPIASVQDGLVAVAADATRVAVVWGTARNVSSLQDLGGFAVFACVP
jgi:hypothetical protein